ncbi:M55 family metallopeptidase [Thermosphaera chiliense]|uniref:M55 family metallopeptidase n=2 Tax=Thermosphaera chiliense TaxID=3402707 RepID=A0A7M1USW3_9CREN|nr:M55 family metallopeptidase [Thermosphaera aggregans]
MKAFISLDVEGLPGVSSLTMLNPWSSQFERTVRVATKIVNTLIEELSNNGFSEIIVADSHGLMTNLDYSEIKGNAKIIQGYPRPLSMVTTLDSTFNASIFIGYHSAAGTVHGILDHTMSGRTFSEIRVNGVRASEFLLNGLYSSENNVPVALVAGDEYLEAEVNSFSPGTVFVPLKKGVSRYSAINPSIEIIIDQLRHRVREAVKRLSEGKIGLISLGKPYVVETVFRDSLIADVVESYDKFQRLNAYTVRFVAENARELIGLIELLAMVGYGVDALKNSIK